jgi:putative transposase
MEHYLPDREAGWQACCMKIQHLNHSTYRLEYHVVWGTRYRMKFLKDYVKKELLKNLYETVKKYPTLYISTVNTDEDHIHLQMVIPPNIAISDAVQKLKSGSSQYLRRKFKFIREAYLEKDGIWSVGYFVSSIGLNEEQVRKYIEWQGKKEKPQTTKLF